jgi:hypothetical protein
LLRFNLRPPMVSSVFEGALNRQLGIRNCPTEPQLSTVPAIPHWHPSNPTMHWHAMPPSPCTRQKIVQQSQSLAKSNSLLVTPCNGMHGTSICRTRLLYATVKSPSVTLSLLLIVSSTLLCTCSTYNLHLNTIWYDTS